MTTFSNVVDAVKSFGSSAASFAKSRPQEIALAASSALTAGSAIGRVVAKQEEKKANNATLNELTGQWIDGSDEKAFIEDLATQTTEFKKNFANDCRKELAEGIQNIKVSNKVNMATGHVQELVDAIDSEQKANHLSKGGKLAKMLMAVGLVGVAASTAALVHKLRGTGKKPEIVDGGPTKPAVPLKPGRKPVHPGPWNPRY